MMKYAAPPRGRRHSRLLFAAVVALASLPALNSRAYADTAENPPQVIVRYSDLNLDSNAGVKTLYRRLTGAAKSVCGKFNQRPLEHRMRWRQCYEQALGAAVVYVNVPSLATLHARNRGTRPYLEHRTVQVVTP